MGSPRLLNKDMKTGLSRSLQTLPTEASAFDTGERLLEASGTASALRAAVVQTPLSREWQALCPLCQVLFLPGTGTFVA